MKRIRYNTPASNRAADKAMRITGGYSCAASLGSKRRTVNATIDGTKENEIIEKLKALKCTSIRITEMNDLS